MVETSITEKIVLTHIGARRYMPTCLACRTTYSASQVYCPNCGKINVPPPTPKYEVIKKGPTHPPLVAIQQTPRVTKALGKKSTRGVTASISLLIIGIFTLLLSQQTVWLDLDAKISLVEQPADYLEISTTDELGKRTTIVFDNSSGTEEKLIQDNDDLADEFPDAVEVKESTRFLIIGSIVFGSVGILLGILSLVGLPQLSGIGSFCILFFTALAMISMIYFYFFFDPFADESLATDNDDFYESCDDETTSGWFLDYKISTVCEVDGQSIQLEMNVMYSFGFIMPLVSVVMGVFSFLMLSNLFSSNS